MGGGDDPPLPLSHSPPFHTSAYTSVVNHNRPSARQPLLRSHTPKDRRFWFRALFGRWWGFCGPVGLPAHRSYAAFTAPGWGCGSGGF